MLLQSLCSKRNTIKDLVFKLDVLSRLLPNKNHGLLSAETKKVSVRPSILLSCIASSGILSHDTLNNYWQDSGTCYLLILHCKVPLCSAANYAQELLWYRLHHTSGQSLQYAYTHTHTHIPFLLRSSEGWYYFGKEKQFTVMAITYIN